MLLPCSEGPGSAAEAANLLSPEELVVDVGTVVEARPLIDLPINSGVEAGSTNLDGVAGGTILNYIRNV